MFETQLFEGERIRFAAYDPDKDAEVESKWTTDTDYLHAINDFPAYPLTPQQIKKRHEDREEEAEKKQLFFWAVRKKEDDRLIGWAGLWNFEWTHGIGSLGLAIGANEDRGQGHGSEAMRMALRFAFDELNLHRLRAIVSEHNAGALRFFARYGFIEEVRRREAILLGGKRYDEVWLGVLRTESDYATPIQRGQNG